MRRAPGQRAALVSGRRGASAVEFAFVVPILLLLLIGIVDVSVLMMTQSNMTRIATDTARRLSLSQMTESEALKHVQDKLSNLGENLEVEAVLPDSDAGEVDVMVAISIPMADVIPIDLVGMKNMNVFKTKSLQTQVTMRQEVVQ